MIFSALGDFLFPKRCVSCGKFGDYFCPACLSQIKFITTPVCPVCERPSISGATHPGCQTRYTLDGLISIWVYEGPVKLAIKRLKYKPWVFALADKLTDLAIPPLGENVSMNQSIKTKPLVVPVPLHKSRQRQRGFNQAALLGKLLAPKLNLEFVPDLLVRQKNTRPQAELKGKERQENIKDAFVISPNILISQYPNILLLDDVWTTGATLRACGNVLKRAGAKSIWGLTLAR